MKMTHGEGWPFFHGASWPIWVRLTKFGYSNFLLVLFQKNEKLR